MYPLTEGLGYLHQADIDIRIANSYLDQPLKNDLFELCIKAAQFETAERIAI
jgi:hypothetical protein